MSYLFTSESVSEGHPDKVCDRVSDTVLDLFLSYEPEARVACETMATTNRIILAGEVRASADNLDRIMACLLYTSPSPRDTMSSRMPSSA